MHRKNKAIFLLMALILGAFAGTVIWALLYIMTFGIEFIWEDLAHKFNTPVFTFVVCIIGAILIGLLQKKYGDLPEELQEIMIHCKKNGSYPYNNLHILAVAALIPLIFGGSLGPEAGLTGIIVGLCYLISDKLKYATREMRELAEAGIAATISVVFNSPFFGLAMQLENNEAEEAALLEGEKSSNECPEEKSASKKDKIVVYVICIVGGMLALMLLTKYIGGGLGLPRFTSPGLMGKNEIIALIPLSIFGVVCGLFYMLCDKITRKIVKPLNDKKILRALIGGIALAAFGTLLPWTMFAGESQMGLLIETWGDIGFIDLFLTGFLKLLLINICINFGWRGGNIFPIIFSGVSMGYAIALLIPVEPVFVVAIVVASMCSAIMGKPIAVLAFLVICFPVTSLFHIGIAAFLGSFMTGFIRKNKGDK